MKSKNTPRKGTPYRRRHRRGERIGTGCRTPGRHRRSTGVHDPRRGLRQHPGVHRRRDSGRQRHDGLDKSSGGVAQLLPGKRRCALLRLELLPGRQPDVPPQPQAGPDDGALRRLRRTDRRDSPHTEKDAPSGTAITLAEGIISEIGRKTGWVNEPSDDLSQIVVTSLREGAVPGTHTVTYESDDDRIELKHTIKNRRTLALGAVVAAEFLCGKRVSIRWTTC